MCIEREKLVYQDGQTVYCYSEIDREVEIGLKLSLLKAQEYCLSLYPINLGIKTKREYAPIYLFLHSYGGDVSSSLAMYDFIKNMQYPVIIIGEGTVASGASIVLLAGTKRYLTKSSQLLLHQARGGESGTHSQMKDHFRSWENEHKSLVEIIKENSDLSKKKIKKILDKESWFTPKEALHVGLIDGIYDTYALLENDLGLTTISNLEDSEK